MQRLEVRRLGLIPGLDERLERVADELGESTAEDDLLAEEVGDRLRSMMPWIGAGRARPRDVSGG